MNLHVKSLIALALCVYFIGTAQSQTSLQCDTANGWFRLNHDKCYKFYQGTQDRSWHRADQVCRSYGSRLVTISDQFENDELGAQVQTLAGRPTSIWIGLKKTGLTSYTWKNNDEITNNQGFWADSQPEGEINSCGTLSRNQVDYVYDRPFVWGLDNCHVKRSFICERMAVPPGSFHCFSGGFVRIQDTCNGRADCIDGSDELNCANLCHTKLTGPNGTVSFTAVGNGQDCSWAIETPLGTNTYITFNTFSTEFMADFVTVFGGSIIETSATQLARLSGSEGSGLQYRSYNNMMLVKFSSDAFQTSQGFTMSYFSVSPAVAPVTTLPATATPSEFSLPSFSINGKSNFLGQRDYIIVINAAPSCSQIITLELLNVNLHDSDRVTFFDGDTPRYPILHTICPTCTHHDVVYSTGTSMSILIQTEMEMSKAVQFRFRYRQGCYYETTKKWGEVFTPGYPGGINYPSNTHCTWKIMSPEPITLLFNGDLALQDDGGSWTDNVERLMIFDNGTALHPASGFSTQLLLTNSVVQASTGIVELKFNTSPTMTARGFYATYSIGCGNPMFDVGTITSPNPVVFHYSASMSLTCAQGYAFQQEGISVNTPTATITCTFQGKWVPLHLPRCTRVYCGDVPNIANGYIVHSDGPQYRDVVSYQCFPGSTLRPALSGGSTNSTCQATGTWSPPPTCTVATCPFDVSRTTVANGAGNVTNKDGTQIGSIITYSCNAGFQFSGEPISFCQNDGTWSSIPPTCIRKKCLLSTAIMNGVYIGRNVGDLVDFNTVVQVQCNTGFEFVNASITSTSCLADRTLTMLPQCKNINECARTPQPCQHKCYDTEGSFYCTCNAGYRLSPTGASPSDTQCADINECGENIDNCDQTCINNQGGYTCSCADPYTLYTADGTSKYFLPVGETGLLPTDTYHINRSCVLKECSEPPNVSNGQIMTKGPYRVNGFVVYKCNIGFEPTYTTLKCLSPGTWDQAIPTCVPARCATEVRNGLQNPAVVVNGPYNYGVIIDLNCTRATQTFTKFRHCTYNKATNAYQMQGSSYECGVIDCGQPLGQPTVSSTLYGASFTFSCPSGSISGSSNQNDSLVRCQANGYWDFGNLQCLGSRCQDPGHPAGGDIVGTSFASGSQVTFKCNTPGYTLTSTTPLTCVGTTWNGPVPQCVDTQAPTIVGCPTGTAQTIYLPKYASVSTSLPFLTYSDNTGIRSFTITPSSANVSLYLETETTVTFTATDYVGQTASCVVVFRVRDETPPTISCPPTYEILLANYGVSVANTFDEATISRNDNSGTTQSFTVNPTLPTSFTDAQLYNTYTYTARVTDANNNEATCKSQLFVKPAACSDLSFPTPLHATRNCNLVPATNTYRCTFTCEDLYTFVDSKTKTVECVNGNWNSPLLPACTRDITPPVITCPTSQMIYLTDRTSEQTITFSQLSYTQTDLNTIRTTTFSPESKVFRFSDLYKTQRVTMTVTDAAGNSASCNFEYLTLPTPCSPVALPRTLFAAENVCSRTANGYSCTITCNEGYILRNIGRSTTVTCTDVGSWQDTSIFPACVVDIVPPTLTCPQSESRELSEVTDVVNIDYRTTNGHIVSDVGGVASVVYSPQTLQLDYTMINTTPSTVFVTATDLNGNSATCSFYVTVKARQCSPLSLPAPLNGQKTCSETAVNPGSWTCTLTCNSGFVFPGTPPPTSITSSCSFGGDFNQYAPACTTESRRRNKEFYGTMLYYYQPVDGTVFTPATITTCVNHYLNQQANTQTSTSKSTYDNMAGKLIDLCRIQNNHFVDVQFQPSQSSGTITGNIIQLKYRYLMTSNPVNTTVYNVCSNTFANLINATSADHPFRQNILGTTGCPTVQWANFASQLPAETGNFCPNPYFEAYPAATAEQCLECPEGTQFTSGTTCTVCPRNTYRPLSSASGCQACPTGYITRYPGGTSINDCISPCSNGYVSSTGYSPCYPCAQSTYWTTSTTCTACPSGQTTPSIGAPSLASCFTPATSAASCSLGTQAVSGGCELCPMGTLRDVLSQTTCRSCPGTLSTYIRGAVDEAMCYAKCSAGLTSTTGMSPCTPCPRGSYFFNSTYCQQCPSGQTTLNVGSTSNIACVTDQSYRVRCPPGTIRTAAGACDLCPIGTYNPNEETTQCTSCGTAKSTYRPGRTSNLQCFDTCAPGFRSTTGLSPCSPCGIGSYWVNATTCLPCSNGATTATTTATSSSDCIAQCPAGQFSFNGYNQNGACRNCPRHHYQTTSQSTMCSRCDPNTRYSTSTGLTDAAQCDDANSLCQPNNPCLNGGVCSIVDNSYRCACPTGYYGVQCQQLVNYCFSSPCFNGGICSSTPAGHTCDCQGRATGTNCETLIPTCTSTTCNTGFCINYGTDPRTKCLCPDGFTGTSCAVPATICSTDPCTALGTQTQQCQDVSKGSNLRRLCVCNPGYTGGNCETNIDDCASTPCINGGTCNDLINGFQCSCPQGYSGTYCQTRANFCTTKSCGEDSNARCVDDQTQDLPRCLCNAGYTFGLYTQYSVEEGRAPPNTGSATAVANVNTRNDCQARCTSQTTCAGFTFGTVSMSCYIWTILTGTNAVSTFTNHNTYVKHTSYPEDNFETLRFKGSTVYPNNVCGGTQPLDIKCCSEGDTTCDPGITSTQCNILSCLNGGCNFDVIFKCAVSRVFLNNVCTRKSDYCASQPCMNGGSCQSAFGTFTCSCPAGYSGKRCQTNINNCDPHPCKEGVMCTDLVNDYRCTCLPGWTGKSCNTAMNFCSGQACSNHGSCVNGPLSYTCQCFAGYTGTNCETELDRCTSSPCLHGGQCTKLFNDYSCTCAPGWQGKNCDQIITSCNINSLGGRCQDTCFDIFKTYYCQCDANTYGVNCENQPSPCRDYNKCLNGGLCSVTGSAMSCQCSGKYQGEGCHILADLCATNNPCKNGATCSLTQTGYQCTCMPGYNGLNCDSEVNECIGVTCPGGGQCYDDINKYHCRCPLKKTGTSCSRDYDKDYDLYFNNPLGQGYAFIPYFIQVTNSNYMSISMWVRYADVGGQGVYLTMLLGDKLSESVKFLEFTETGIIVYLTTFEHITFDVSGQLNNGHWHLVNMVCNMVTGDMVLFLDTVIYGTLRHAELVMPNATFRFWTVLGCDFDQTANQCSGGQFHGFLSQVNWYARELYHRIEQGTQNIPYLFDHPQHVYDSPLSSVLLVWNEYQLQSGVVRVNPSGANGQLCTDVGRVPPCRFFTSIPRPTTSNCPNDIFVYSADRLITITWTPPTFSNLGNGMVSQPEYQPGSTFTWGIYNITYMAVAENGNRGYCSFKIYVASERCIDRPEGPFSGLQDCDSTHPSGWTGCRLSCTNPAEQVDRVHPNDLTCSDGSGWNVAQRFKKFRYPACGVTETPSTRVDIRLIYGLDTSACIRVKSKLEFELQKVFLELNTLYGQNLCSALDCSDVTVNITCLTPTTRVDIVIPSALATYPFGSITTPVEDFLTYRAFGHNIFSFSVIPGDLQECIGVHIAASKHCPDGKPLVDDTCVQCGPGNFYRMLADGMAICDDCPIGFYQSGRGRNSCEPCPSGKTTMMTGSYEISHCYTKCPVGQYFDVARDVCVQCDIGYYQDKVGSFYCEPCGAGYTTEFTGTNSSARCTGTCDHGYQLNGLGNCIPCSIGTYRNATLHRVCQTCTTGYITASVAAKSVTECTVAACLPGTYLNTTLNQCFPCTKGYYQDQLWQKSCNICNVTMPDRYTTLYTGTIYKTDCIFFCPSGFEVQSEGVCVPCTEFKYKDNNVDFRSLCRSCPTGYRAPMQASTKVTDCTIYMCSAGYYPNRPVNGDSCLPCPLGTYNEAANSVNCTNCSTGLSTLTTNSTSSTQCLNYCASGYYRANTGACLACDKGTYKDNNDGLFQTCKPCPDFFTTAGSATTNRSQCSIRRCPPGTKRSADENSCVSCPLGTYQPSENQPDCFTCSAGTSTRLIEATASTQCETYCPSGQEKIGTACVSCPRGYYKDNNGTNNLFGACMLCPAEFITPTTGAKILAECRIGNCSAGSRLNALDQCELCPKGYYTETKWLLNCTKCGVDKTTETTGANNASLCILECQPGYEDVSGLCQRCQRGYYKPELAAAACTRCPTGTTTEITGASNSVQCSLPYCTAGQYLDRTGTQPTCKICPYDTYQTQPMASECSNCQSGRVTLKTGATLATDCVLDCESGSAYDAVSQRCVLCERGYYRNKTIRAQTSCQLCNINFITPSVGAVDARDCTVANCTTPGTYISSSNQCAQCPISSYNALKWRTSCDACPSGQSTRTVGSTSINDCRRSCPLGQYVDANNLCQLCPKNFYRSDPATDVCTPCPDGLNTREPGADSSGECTLSPCTAGQKYVVQERRCYNCEIGTYQPAAGEFQCINCPNSITYTPRTGATSVLECRSPCNAGEQFNTVTEVCSGCPIGQYQPLANQFNCINCPDGKKFTQQTGTTNVNQCLSFCDVATANTCSVNATCTTTASDPRGYRCQCFVNYDSLGTQEGSVCRHKCDNNFCKNGGVCQYEPTPRCLCTEWYEGSDCNVRKNAEQLASNDVPNIAIPVGIGVGGGILLLILLAVACLCFRASRATPKPTNFTSYPNERVDKTSLYSYEYGHAPYNGGGRLMMAPVMETVYDNQGYVPKEASKPGSVIDSAIYHA